MRAVLRAGVIGLVTAGLGLALAAAPLGVSLEERFGLNWLFHLRGHLPPPDDVTVVSLDRRSAEQLDLPEKIRDWPRTLHADLIDRLAADGASVIVFDLILEREREAAADRAVVRAMADAGRVVLFEALELQRQPVPAALGLLETQRLRPPIDAFAEAAAGLGPFPLPIVPDRVSQVWLFQPGAGGRPTLPAVALQRHALAAHDRWLTLLNRAQADGAGTLPRDRGTLADAAALRRLMTDLRRMFLADSGLGDRLRNALSDMAADADTQRRLRALIDLYDGPDSRYLNFYGPAGQITTVSLADALDRAAAANGPGWPGQGVFVGQSELYEPHNDAFITVYSRPDGVKISGVEIAATAFANLLGGRLVDPSPYGALAIAVFGLLIGAVASLLPGLVAVPAGFALGGVYLLGAEAAFARQALWFPTTVPLLAQLPAGLFAGLFIQYREARRARENLSRAIRYYLPDKIAEGFSHGPTAPLMEDEEAYAYCLITDASGFTHLAEKMRSRELKPFLEAYLEILFRTVETHGGRVTDSVGDGITAAWTSPRPDPSIAAKACQAALAIDREVQAFNTQRDPLRLPTRLGLNAGWVTLGHVGGAGRFTYTVVGDAVNTASRIEQLNKHLGTRILATRAVVDGVPDLTTRPLGRFQLFGKEEILEMVEFANPNISHFQLIIRFSEALSAFKSKEWQKAAKLFAAIADEFQDTAAHFYTEMCRYKIENPESTNGSDILKLLTK